MPKQLLFGILICSLLLSLPGCGKGGAAGKEEAGSAAWSSAPSASDSVESALSYAEESEAEAMISLPPVSEVNGTGRTNDTGLYIGADNVGTLMMGTRKGEEEIPLCKVTMPLNYAITALYVDESGGQLSLPEAAGASVLDVLEGESDTATPHLPATVVLSFAGDPHEMYSFAVERGDVISAASEEASVPGGSMIEDGHGHTAYVHKSEGIFDLVVVSDLSPDWTMVIQYAGPSQKHRSAQELGEMICRLMEPII